MSSPLTVASNRPFSTAAPLEHSDRSITTFFTLTQLRYQFNFFCVPFHYTINRSRLSIMLSSGWYIMTSFSYLSVFIIRQDLAGNLKARSSRHRAYHVCVISIKSGKPLYHTEKEGSRGLEVPYCYHRLRRFNSIVV